MILSFSSDVKEELSKLNTYSNIDNLKSELIGYLISNAIIKNTIVIFTSENPSNIQRIYSVLRKIYGFKDKNIELQNKNRSNLYMLPVDKEIFEDLDFIAFNYKITVNKENVEEYLKNNDSIYALMRGAFMGSGNITNPNTKYHLEIIFKDIDMAELFCDLALYVNINFKIVQRNGEYTIYLKEGQQISDFLASIGANSAMLRFEETRVVKDVRNNVNRIVNCETANLNKTIDASINVINDIKYLKNKKIYSSLPENLKEIASLRIKYPNLSLKELGLKLEKPISKSGVSHRLNKISEIADESRKDNI